MHPQVNLVPNSVEHATDPYYSNEGQFVNCRRDSVAANASPDVEILHNIVVLAQELLPSLPERERLPTNALFNAYYDILPRIGIDADHDSRYARILFKIGGLRGPGTLYEKFEQVLSRMGIEIEFDSGAIEEDDSPFEDSQTKQDDFATGDASLPNEKRDSRSRPRRNSESSVWDLTHHTPTVPGTRRNSFSSVGPIKLSTAIEERESHAPSEFTETTADIGDEASTRASTPLQPATQYEEPCASMQIKASKIHQHTVGLYAKLQLRRWKEKALHAQKRNACLQQIATQHDKKALLHSALDAWRFTFLESRELTEKRKYYEDLEQRAQKARDLYLLDLALSHWSSLAREQVQRTARARQHIMKNRIFTAWKDVAAADELIARKQVLKKFIVAWKYRSSTIAQANAAAVQRYEANLVEKIYRQWLHNIWYLKATNWCAERLAHQALTHWIAKSRSNREAGREIEDKRSLECASNLWQIWRAKTETQAQRSEQAGAYYEENLCRSLLQKWRRETKIIPAKKALQTEVSKRLLGEAFGIWRKRTSQERQAAAVDRTKILHEALIVWRHKQRSQELTSRIDNRVLKQAMLSWVRVAREKRVQQSSNDQLLRRVLRTWKNKQQVSTEQREDREIMAQSFAARQAQNLVLRQWYSRMETQQRNEIAAVDFYAPRLVRGSMTEWSNKLQNIRQLQQRSRDAGYYFLASKSLKLWKAATESSRREKRKAAYIQVRRNMKINLARRVLKAWRGKVQPIMELQSQASNIYHNKQIVLAMEIFDRWRGRAEELSELESLARENILKKYVTVWKERLNTQQALSTEATIAYQELRQSRTLKKWSLTSLQLRAQANYAREIREKNAKRNVRKILVYWHQRAVQKRPPAIETTSMSENGEDIEPDARTLDELGQSSHLPGYLSTPSKRVRILSTTPRAPLSTPFERRLRAQWSGGGKTPRSRLVD
jgi:protein SFI1